MHEFTCKRFLSKYSLDHSLTYCETEVGIASAGGVEVTRTGDERTHLASRQVHMQASLYSIFVCAFFFGKGKFSVVDSIRDPNNSVFGFHQFPRRIRI